MLGTHAALVHTMVLMSVADHEMTDSEIGTMQEMIGFLPVFADFDFGGLEAVVNSCVEWLKQGNGLDKAISRIKAALPTRLRETAYALACDVAAADGEASQEELRLLEILRDELELDRLHAAAIERGARARFQRV
jgi:tellurite resistance protein